MVWLWGLTQRWKIKQIQKFSQLGFPSHTHTSSSFAVCSVSIGSSSSDVFTVSTEEALDTLKRPWTLTRTFTLTFAHSPDSWGTTFWIRNWPVRSNVDINKASIEKKDHTNNILSVTCWICSTYTNVRVWQLLQVVVVSFKCEGFFPVEGQNFREGCCVVLGENFTITAGNQWQKLQKQDYGKELCMLVNSYFHNPYFSPSSAAEFHFREIE